MLGNKTTAYQQSISLSAVYWQSILAFSTVVDVDEDDDTVNIDRYDDMGRKIGAKKMAKLQEKEEKRRMREVRKWDL